MLVLENETGKTWSQLIFLLVGAALGFVLGQINEWLEARRAKKAFLSAIRSELVGLKAQLESSRDNVLESQKRFEGASPPHFAYTLRTIVFDTQLGKLRDVADQHVQDVIRIYSDVAILKQGTDILNEHALEYSKSSPGSPQQRLQENQVFSALKVLAEQMDTYLAKIEMEIAKLPK